ncbi:MAG: DNA polymerase III subunit delta, partial [Pseudomonadota bacterium]
MTALKGRAIEAFVERRERDVSAVLIYGPDAGLIRERADRLARAVVADFKDPFNFIELTDADVKAEPGRLADEAAALSFAGGERVVRLRTSGESAAKAAQALVDGLDGGYLAANALVVIDLLLLGPLGSTALDLHARPPRLRLGAARPALAT